MRHKGGGNEQPFGGDHGRLSFIAEEADRSLVDRGAIGELIAELTAGNIIRLMASRLPGWTAPQIQAHYQGAPAPTVAGRDSGGFIPLTSGIAMWRPPVGRFEGCSEVGRHMGDATAANAQQLDQVPLLLVRVPDACRERIGLASAGDLHRGKHWSLDPTILDADKVLYGGVRHLLAAWILLDDGPHTLAPSKALP